MFEGRTLADGLIAILNTIARAEGFRIGLTFAIVLTGLTIMKVVERRLATSDVSVSMSERRQRKVLTRNLVLTITILSIVSLWVTKIASFALGLAAVAGAMIIVSKELVMNLQGFATLSVLRPYSVGDFIELGGHHGIVVDINPMATTLLETKQGSQITGATVAIPNSLLLTQVVRNTAATGLYALYLLPIRIKSTEDVLAHEEALQKAAEMVVAPWKDMADAHFQRLESSRHVALPSAECKVILEASLEACHCLTLRYPCEPNQRVKTEQSILRIYLATRPPLSKMAHHADLAAALQVGDLAPSH